ncbi:multicopper oxidase domain-containing protein [Legionella gresilensis]|uniref:multicopper oxidase domain-containing protein n=1 Tax=Legionella gresilensis TaxID=91823 RepID=UPI0010411104|nr:multicopper oxidase domain-containing protein [Legionella gresilensis]
MLVRSLVYSFFLFSFLLCFNLWAQHEHHMNKTPSNHINTLNEKSSSFSVVKPLRRKVTKGYGHVNAQTEHVINLVVAYKWVNFAGKMRRAIAVNNQIPAPTLRFKEEERVHIIVHNQLDVGTAIHWHGILVPWQMDGVEHVTQKPILPGKEFHYRFTPHQSGTYWYHAHADVQEQDGLYGAFLIDPKRPPAYQYNKDYVIVLSDWSNIPAEQVFFNLKKDGDYFAPKFPLQPSLSKFIQDYQRADASERKSLVSDYTMMQQMRMSIYDISDVAYDAFLLNGQPNTYPWTALVKTGDVVRLRFIGAGASTTFRVKIQDSPMTMVHAQGNDIKPFTVQSFDIAPGETYDVLVRVQKHSPYLIYAESIDTIGAAIGALITSPNQPLNFTQITRFPEPLPVTRLMMANMMEGMSHGSKSPEGMKHSMQHNGNSTQKKSLEKNSREMRVSVQHQRNRNHHSIQKENTKHLNHVKEMPAQHSSHQVFSDIEQHSRVNENSSMNHAMSMPTEPSIVGDAITPLNNSNAQAMTMGTKYQDLTAAIKTNNPNRPVDGVIRMELFGYMERFIWFINGLPEYKAKPILIEPGKRYRIIFTNNSMMRHPMHIHGHWFILRNGHGAYDPLLHTINVPPGATAVADFDTDASGQWFFHCHQFYHMMAGMARTFQYRTLLEVVKGLRAPEYEIASTDYYNRPIVRVDELVPIDKNLTVNPVSHRARFYFASFLDIAADPFNSVQRLTYLGLYGPDYHKLQLFTNDAEFSHGEVESADIDIFYWHLISQFWAIKGGANYFNEPAFSPYWQPGVGIEGVLPYFIATNLRSYYYNGSVKLDLELLRDTQLTNNLFLRLGIRSILATKTVAEGGIGNGLNQMRYIVGPYYRLMPGLNLTAEFEHEKAYGSFKKILRGLKQDTSENTLTFGLSILF